MSEIVTGHFRLGHDSIAFSRYLAASPTRHTLVSFHGAGPAGRERMDYICRYLQDRGTSSFTFDFTGHGDSSGRLSDSSLIKRSEEARMAIELSGFDSPSIFVGTSMGGFIALMLLENYAPSHLVLFCPAMYGDAALEIPFDERFTKTIRANGSFEGSRYVETLRQFRGKTLIFLGTEDKVIPRRVIEIYEEARLGREHETILLGGAEHVLHKWALAEKNREKLILSKVEEFIS
jgi:uncharacterized protein